MNRLVVSERCFKQKKIRCNGTKKYLPLVQLNGKKKCHRTINLSNNVQETSKASETIIEQETNEVSIKDQRLRYPVSLIIETTNNMIERKKIEIKLFRKIGFEIN